MRMMIRKISVLEFLKIKTKGKDKKK